jgi:DNA-binding NtrC family response regulator
MSEPDAPNQSTVLFIDDDRDILTAAQLLLSRHAMVMTGATTLDQGRDLLAAGTFDLLLLDLNFRRGDADGAAGLAFLEAHMASDPAAKVVVVTGHSGLSIAVRAMRLGAADFVMKPWHNDRLIATLRAAIDTPRPRLPPPEPADLNLQRSERMLIVQALTRHAHNISLAARDLGLTRAALYRRMEKHGL